MEQVSSAESTVKEEPTKDAPLTEEQITAQAVQLYNELGETLKDFVGHPASILKAFLGVVAQVISTHYPIEARPNLMGLAVQSILENLKISDSNKSQPTQPAVNNVQTAS